MKENCRNCKHGSAVTKDFVRKAGKVRAEIAEVKKNFILDERHEKIAVIKASPDFVEVHAVKGGADLTEKSTDPRGGSVYIACDCAAHLLDLKTTEKAVAHKYYYSCPRFVESEDQLDEG